MTEPLLALENPPASQLDTEARTRFFDSLEDIAGLPTFSEQATRASVFELPFYPDKELIVLRNDSWRPLGAQLCFVQGEGDLWHLNGTSPPIHEINANTELVLTESNVLNYLAFFCFFVRGEEGPFFIIDRPENMFLPKGAFNDELKEVYRAPQLWGQDPDGDWRASALIYYSNAVFIADFSIHLSGMVEMEDDQPVLADLEDEISAPLHVDEVESHEPAIQHASMFSLTRWFPRFGTRLHTI